MRVLIVGGYGVFGGRVAKLLGQLPGVHLLIAGRSIEKAKGFVAEFDSAEPATPACFDRNGDIERQLLELRPNLLIDASGPFQAYGSSPYALIEAAIANGIHYIDLADGSEFVLNIRRFDEQAKARGVFVLSGASTCPALTAAVVRHLASDLRTVDTIAGGVAPSPHTKVGLSVIEAITSYAGKPVSVRSRGKTDTAHAFVDTRLHRVSPASGHPLSRLRFSLLDVPDLQLFIEEYPDVSDVWFGAAPTPAIFHWMLRLLARAVKSGLLGSVRPLAKFIFRTINRFSWGHDRGGMFIEVCGQGAQEEYVRKTWSLTINGDHGPLIPTLASKALVLRLLHGKPPAPGARCANLDLELDDFVPLLEEIGANIGERVEPSSASWPLFRRVLGNAWHELPAEIRNLHDVSDVRKFRGKASVVRGKSILARLVGRIVGFPESSSEVPVEVTITRRQIGEFWQRDFSGHKFSSVMTCGRAGPGDLLWEKFGPARIGMALIVKEQQLHLLPMEWTFFGLPLPKFLVPSGRMYESAADGRFNFHVEVCLPLAGHIVTYKGWLQDASAS